MAQLSAERAEINARILYWGAEGAGKSANLKCVYRKLRADHRGELRSVPTPLDPSVGYEMLPITLGAIAGMQVRLQIIAVPGAAEHAPTRKQLLDRVDGVVLVLDSQPDRIDANLEAFDELRRSLSAYGRSLEDVALVVQYNKRDLADDYTLEELHRKLELHGAAVFEAVANEGKGVLQALTTISKRVIRQLREQGLEGMSPATPQPLETPEAPPVPEPPHPEPVREAEPPLLTPLEEGLAAEELDPGRATRVAEATSEAETLLEDSWGEVTAHVEDVAEAAAGPEEITIASIGAARQTDERGFEIPVTLRDAEGRSFTLSVSVRLELVDGAGED
jgi:signal recognition particle receptor subunit beta